MQSQMEQVALAAAARWRGQQERAAHAAAEAEAAAAAQAAQAAAAAEAEAAEAAEVAEAIAAVAAAEAAEAAEAEEAAAAAAAAAAWAAEAAEAVAMAEAAEIAAAADAAEALLATEAFLMAEAAAASREAAQRQEQEAAEAAARRRLQEQQAAEAAVAGQKRQQQEAAAAAAARWKEQQQRQQQQQQRQQQQQQQQQRQQQQQQQQCPTAAVSTNGSPAPRAPQQPASQSLARPVEWTPALPRKYAVGHCSEARYAELDAYARACPEAAEGSMRTLAAYLVQAAKDEEERARVLHSWVCAKISYDMEGLRSGKYGDLSAGAMLRRRSGVCSGFAHLFKGLCDEAGVTCVVVSGLATEGPGLRGASSSSGPARPNHAWNAVELGSRGWALIDCTWSSGYSSGGTWFRQYKDFYFLTRPEALIVDHLPLGDSSRWALLGEATPSLEQWRRGAGQRDLYRGWY